MAAPTPAVAALERAKVPYQLHRYEHDPAAPAYGPEAAAALGVSPERVLKTLVCGPEGAAPTAVAVLPVDAVLDLRSLAGVLGVKSIALTAPADAERATGYVLGGISPFGQKRRLTTVIDETATTFPTVFVSGGRRGLEIEVSPDDLQRLTGGRYAAIARWSPAGRSGQREGSGSPL